MKIIECEQGSDQWIAARLGIPTASAFSKIITPKKGDISASRFSYMYQLVAEWVTGEQQDSASTPFMERGTELEGDAARWYEFERELDTQTVGFCLRDDGKVGCSPDRLVGDDGLLEIKCPSAPVHVGYLLGGGVDDAYRCQIQGQLWITGRKWCDVLSYNPTIESVIVRVERDAEFLAKLHFAVNQFIKELDEAKERLASHRAVRLEAAAKLAEGEPVDWEDFQAGAVSIAGRGQARYADLVDE